MPAATGSWINLEDGVQVQFSPGTYATGDYWMIPARTLTANIHWPVDGGGNPLALPPKGIQKQYARVAVLQYDGTTWSVIANCLPIFYPITTNTRTNGIHVIDVRTNRPDAELLNDSDLNLLSSFDGGVTIRVICDTAIDPVSAKPATCYVTVALPYTSSANANLTGLGFQIILLPATVSLNANNAAEIDIGLSPLALRLLYDQVSQSSFSRLLTRVTLKGGFIWAASNPQLYLDGEAFGVTRQDPTGNRIGMRIPKSGNGTPGSDFEMWFWFTRPVTLSSLTFSPNPVNTGAASTGAVSLNASAPPGGATITLAASSSAGTISPTTLTIPEGQLSASFNVTNTTVPAGAASATLQVTATYGTSTTSGTLTINLVAQVTAVSFNPASVLGGTAGTGTVTLNLPAPAGGAVVTLAGSDASMGTVPASVTVAAGQTTQTFQVATVARQPNSAPVNLSVTATYSGSTAKGTLSITGVVLK